jgi:hypothetical protein
VDEECDGLAVHAATCLSVKLHLKLGDPDLAKEVVIRAIEQHGQEIYRRASER